jgi:threonine dehydrogenase-like Zn-dependent dehydrogenase
VLAANRLGAERILLMGRHKDRTDLGREFGATDVIDGLRHLGAQHQPGSAQSPHPS